MKSDYVCSAVALDVLMWSWFDSLLPCTMHTYIHRNCWRKGESLECGCRDTAAAAILLHYCCTAIYCFCIALLLL